MELYVVLPATMVRKSGQRRQVTRLKSNDNVVFFPDKTAHDRVKTVRRIGNHDDFVDIVHQKKLGDSLSDRDQKLRVE